MRNVGHVRAMLAQRAFELIDQEGETVARSSRQAAPGSSRGGGDAVYGLGLIGAFIWFWQQADGFGEHLVGVLKSFVWPAFLIYEAFKEFTG